MLKLLTMNFLCIFLLLLPSNCLSSCESRNNFKDLIDIELHENVIIIDTEGLKKYNDSIGRANF